MSSGVVAEKRRQRNRRQGSDREFPEVLATAKSGQSDRLDDLDRHQAEDDQREYFGHQSFDQARPLLSKN